MLKLKWLWGIAINDLIGEEYDFVMKLINRYIKLDQPYLSEEEIVVLSKIYDRVREDVGEELDEQIE